VRKIVIGGITLGALLIVGGVRIADLWWSRTKTLTAAESRAANLALILSEYINEAFAAGDASLRQLVIHSGRIGGPAASDSEWAPSLASARAGLTDITSISVVDAEGVIRHSTLAENTAAHRAGYGGLGLGLAIVRSLVELHGGRVVAQSEGAGCGATFTVTIPMARESAAVAGSRG